MAMPDLLLMLIASGLTATAALWWLLPARTARRAPSLPAEEMSLLFEDGDLMHGSDAALARFALVPGHHRWEDLRATLLARFPDFPVAPKSGRSGSMLLQAEDGDSPAEVHLSWRDALCWLHIPRSEPGTDVPREMRAQLAALRRASDANPNPAWQADACGRVVWHNRAYAALKRAAHDQPDASGAALFSTPEPEHPNRVCLQGSSDANRHWYALTTKCEDGLQVYHATCIDAVVAAEEAQRNFVQTLAKTFAHLSIGLAIFDRNSQLALFNPALVDLTALPAPFLSARPTMVSFFDQLRENRRMPEPKNYLNWRQKIAEVIAAATDGRYQETWTLETGQTFSVRGRPHPDGATAFLIEDITAEVTLTRNFRAELELTQSLLDRLDDGFAVFSASGVLTFCNTAYRDLWQQDPDSSFADITITDAVSVWQQMSAPNPLWPEIVDFVSARSDRAGWSMPIYPLKGAPLRCEVSPIAHGATLVRFRAEAVPASRPDARPATRGAARRQSSG